jgi:Zn-dependent protease with chaperone function
MRDRWAVVTLVAGLTVFCTIGLLVGHPMATVGVGLAGLALTVGAAGAVQVARHRQLVRGLRSLSVPSRLAGLPVRTGDFGGVFVAGLIRPTVFADRGLPDQLRPGELRAVLLHEQAHQRARDPARLLVLDLVAPVLRRWSWGHQWLARSTARREIDADRYALENGATKRDLASALLRLEPVARAGVAGFTPAAELRLRALLGEAVDLDTPAVARRVVALLLGLTLGAATCTWFLHHLLESALAIVCC